MRISHDSINQRAIRSRESVRVITAWRINHAPFRYDLVLLHVTEKWQQSSRKTYSFPIIGAIWACTIRQSPKWPAAPWEYSSFHLKVLFDFWHVTKKCTSGANAVANWVESSSATAFRNFVCSVFPGRISLLSSEGITFIPDEGNENWLMIYLISTS